MAERSRTGFDRVGRAHRDRTSPASALLLLMMPLSILLTVLVLAWLTSYLR